MSATAPAPQHDLTRIQGGDLRAYEEGQITLDLSVCGNRYGPPPGALAAVKDLLDRRPHEIAPPPYGCEVPFLEAFAAHLGVEAAELVPGRGVTEFLYILARRVLRDQNVAVIVPDYTQTLELFHYGTFYGAPEPVRDTAESRLERVRRAMACHDAVILSNPCNPTGHFIDGEDLLQSCLDHPQSLLVVDEEYIALQDPKLTLAGAEVDNLIVLQSVGKMYGAVGVRAGVAWTRSRERHQRLSNELISWPLSLLDSVLATSALANETAWLAATREAIHRDARRLEKLLVTSFGLRVQPAQLHYRFVHLREAEAVAEHLAQHGIAVRAFDGHGHTVAGLRITAPKGPKELAQLATALEALPSRAAA